MAKVQIQSNDNWSVGSKPDWVTSSPASGSRNGSAEVTVAVNASEDARSGQLVYATEHDDKQAAVTIEQNGYEIWTQKLVVTPSRTEVGLTGGTVVFEGAIVTYLNGREQNRTEVVPTIIIYPDFPKWGTVSGNTVTIADRTGETGDMRTVYVTCEYDGNVSERFAITQGADNIVKSEKSISITSDKSELSAGGGNAQITASGTITNTYLSGYVEVIENAFTPAIAWANGNTGYSGFTLSGSTLTAADRGTTIGERRSAVVRASYEGNYKDVTVYQQANEATTITYGTPSVSLKVSDIPASGGSVSSGTVSYSQKRTQNYTSGATSALSDLTTGGSVSYSAAVSASSLGTTIKTRTKVGTLTATVSMNGKSGAGSADVYQQANDYYDKRGALHFDSPAGSSYKNVSAGQNSVNVFYEVVRGFTSGAEEGGHNVTAAATFSISPSDAGSVSGNKITINSRGTNIGNARNITVTGYYGDEIPTNPTATIEQNGNYVTELSFASTAQPEYTTIPAQGGTVVPTYSGSTGVSYKFSSGATTTTLPPVSAGTQTISRIFSWPGPGNGFTALNTDSGALTAPSKGTTISNTTWSPTITSEVTVKFVHSAEFSAGGTITNSYQKTNVVAQSANEKTLVGFTNTAKSSNPASSGSQWWVKANGGTVTATVTANYSYTSGSTSSEDVTRQCSYSGGTSGSWYSWATPVMTIQSAGTTERPEEVTPALTASYGGKSTPLYFGREKNTYTESNLKCLVAGTTNIDWYPSSGAEFVNYDIGVQATRTWSSGAVQEDVNTGYPPTVSSNQTWCSATVSGGKVNIAVTANTGPIRYATITISYPNAVSATINIYQPAGEKRISVSISKGGTITSPRYKYGISEPVTFSIYVTGKVGTTNLIPGTIMSGKTESSESFGPSSGVAKVLGVFTSSPSDGQTSSNPITINGITFWWL